MLRRLLRSCDILFLGMMLPCSSIVCWCWSPIGYTSACFSFLMHSGVSIMPYPRSTSDFIALCTCSRASAWRADLWLPRSS